MQGQRRASITYSERGFLAAGRGPSPAIESAASRNAEPSPFATKLFGFAKAKRRAAVGDGAKWSWHTATGMLLRRRDRRPVGGRQAVCGRGTEPFARWSRRVCEPEEGHVDDMLWAPRTTCKRIVGGRFERSAHAPERRQHQRRPSRSQRRPSTTAAIILAAARRSASLRIVSVVCHQNVVHPNPQQVLEPVRTTVLR